MKLSEAQKAATIITAWLEKQKLQYKKDGLEFDASAKVKESDKSKGWWGVHIYTDGLAYDELYSDEGYFIDEAEAEELRSYGAKKLKAGPMGGTRSELERNVLQKMGWKRDDHYFENYGEGIIMFY